MGRGGLTYDGISRLRKPRYVNMIKMGTLIATVSVLFRDYKDMRPQNTKNAFGRPLKAGLESY